MLNVNIKLQRDNFDMEINQAIDNGITGVYGPSGSGKTSLLKTISGLEQPDKGDIFIGNKLVYSSSKKINLTVRQRNVGFVFQEGRLFPHMSVKQNLRYGQKKEGEKALLEFNEVVDLLNLKHILNSKPTKISGGEWQRTALGRSLLSSPKILLLDEPFSALDIGLREQIIPFLLKIHKKIDIPILVVSHEITDLLKLTNQLLIIEKGKCIGHNNYHRLIASPGLKHILKRHSLMNAIDTFVDDTDTCSGITRLRAKGSAKPIKIVCEKSNVVYNPGDEIKVFIRPDDIALSKQEIGSITIQNQLEGTILDAIERENVVFCIVDVGFPLVAEITRASLDRLDIQRNQKILCLFKSASIDVAY